MARPIALALLSVVLAMFWQSVAVNTSFHGNWTALFCAGDQFQRPPEIQDREYVFPGISGYDGQFYQLIAHDPFMARHYDRFIDAPRLRYRRILMPGIAYLLAMGQDRLIDWAYYLVCWCFIGLGTFCLAELASDWGLLFVIAPATLSAIERMTVDVSLTALVPAALFAARKERWMLLWVACAGAMLAKETGLLVILAVALWLARQEKYRLAGLMGTSILPALAWYAYVQSHTGGDYGTSDFRFLSSFWAFLTPPLSPDFVAVVFRAATIAAGVAILWSAVRCIYLAVRDRFHDLALLLCFLFGALVLLFQNSSIWEEPNGFTRIYSPLLVALIAATFTRGFRQTVVSFGLAASPMCLQAGVHFAGPVWRLLNR